MSCNFLPTGNLRVHRFQLKLWVKEQEALGITQKKKLLLLAVQSRVNRLKFTATAITAVLLAISTMTLAKF